jgi:asparagine synthase (glutamine-hydrolysing)
LSDVPVAAFLSGGLDSSVITALAARISSRRIRTYSVAFAGDELDESRYAGALAERYGTEHVEVHLSPAEAAAQVPKAVAAMDQPTADGVNTFLVSYAVNDSDTKVVLSGLGADEIFGGYRSFWMLPAAQRWSRVAPMPSWLSPLLPGGQRAVDMLRRGASLETRYDSLRAYWSTREMRNMQFAPSSRDGHGSTSTRVTPADVARLELTRYMQDTLLRDADCLSMSRSLELRVPFLDHELAECVIRSGATDRGRKQALIDATRDLLPSVTYNRPKQGFVLPMASWMRGPLRSFVRDGLEHTRASRALPGVDLDQLASRFEAGALQWSRLWQFVVLGHWMANTLAAQPLTACENRESDALSDYSAQESKSA